MAIPKFDPGELRETGRTPGMFGNPEVVIFNHPATFREAYAALYRKEPIWQITSIESMLFAPKCNPDNIARAFVYDGTNTPRSGGADMFGIEWEYIEEAGGSMVRPGRPLVEDAGEISEKVVWPDIDSWDWAGCAAANAEYLSGDRYINAWFLNGWYERLISFMDFEGAVMALIDEDQKDAVHDFFDRLSDLYIRIFDKYITYFPQIDGFCIHDDWGSQKETFFSPATAAEMIVPYMRRVTDFLHSRGKSCELHSCGHLLKQVPNMIAAGWDAWFPQMMNDTEKIYELYGDRIIVGVAPEMYDPAAVSEEEQREKARQYAEKFCNPDKPSFFNIYAGAVLTPAYRQELYKQSRIRYGGQAAR